MDSLGTDKWRRRDELSSASCNRLFVYIYFDIAHARIEMVSKISKKVMEIQWLLVRFSYFIRVCSGMLFFRPLRPELFPAISRKRNYRASGIF